MAGLIFHRPADTVVRLTGVGVGGAHYDHRGSDSGGFSQAQTVVLLLGEYWHLIIGIFNIYDHLQENVFTTLHIRKGWA